MANIKQQYKARRHKQGASRSYLGLKTRASSIGKSNNKRTKLNITAIKHEERESNKSKEKVKVHA